MLRLIFSFLICFLRSLPRIVFFSKEINYFNSSFISGEKKNLSSVELKITNKVMRAICCSPLFEQKLSNTARLQLGNKPRGFDIGAGH